MLRQYKTMYYVGVRARGALHGQSNRGTGLPERGVKTQKVIAVSIVLLLQIFFQLCVVLNMEYIILLCMTIAANSFTNEFYATYGIH